MNKPLPNSKTSMFGAPVKLVKRELVERPGPKKTVIRYVIARIQK